MDSKMKNNDASDKIRQKGNKRFVKGDYFEALTLYNEALRYAELNSKQLGLCYGNRSAAFLKVKQYKACLENIEFARENQFPEDILPKLREREKECKIILETIQSPLEETWNEFYKLSYEPNPKFPYLSKCLELKKHKQGMFLTTNRDLKAGDIVAITEPFVQFSSDTGSYRCNYCLADKFMNFIPCSGCTEAMFCNEICMQKALIEFHQFECGVLDNPDIDECFIIVLRVIMKCHSLFNGNQSEMENFLTSNKKKLHTPFDFDLSDPSSVSSQKNIMLTQLCLNQQIGDLGLELPISLLQPFLNRHPKLRKITTRKMFNLASYYALGDSKRYKSIGGKALSSNNQDQGQFTINYFGDAIDICSNIIRYSCAPNMILHPYNGKIIWIIHYPIKANDWLTVAFNNVLFSEKSLAERLEKDVGNIVARCKCAACVGKWDRVFAVLVTPIHVMRHSSETAIEKFGEYCDEINKIAKPLSNGCDDDVWYYISNFRWNVIQIGKASFWDQIAPMKLPMSFF